VKEVPTTSGKATCSPKAQSKLNISSVWQLKIGDQGELKGHQVSQVSAREARAALRVEVDEFGTL
jgi:hypothetical protein